MDLISTLNQMDIEDLKSMYYTLEKRCETLEERCSKLENKLNAVKQKQAKKYSDTLRKRERKVLKIRRKNNACT